MVTRLGTMDRRAFLSLTLAFAAAAAAQAPASRPVRVLFIGNSLIARDDLPDRLARLAKRMGREVVVASVTHDDYSLADHWSEGKAQARLAEKWDFVVLQQGPSARPASRKALVADAVKFADAIRAAGAQPVLFSAWPAQSNPEDFPDAIRSHRAAAEAARATLIPVAEAWLRAVGADSRLRLYTDGLHASANGNDLALLATWFTLFPAGPQDFDEAYATRLGEELRLQGRRRDALIDAATRAIDQPMVLK